MNVGNII